MKTLEETQQMQLRLVLPDRPLWVGETVDGTLEWYLRGDVGRPAFSLPLFDQEEWIEVEPAPAPAAQQRLRGIQAGSRALELPHDQGKGDAGWRRLTRFRFQFRLTPNKPGTLIPAPARVMAEVQVGYGRDLFGFQVPQSRLFQALSKPVRIEIQPMPQAGRPPSFKTPSVAPSPSMFKPDARWCASAIPSSSRSSCAVGAAIGADPAGCRGDGAGSGEVHST